MAAPFKAYDIRGLVGQQLDEKRVYLIGRALAQEVFAPADTGVNTAASTCSDAELIVVSRDMRTHSPAFSAALIRGLSEGGCNVLDIGLAATPMNYWANVHYQARGSVMVTASHNGAQYNGFKVSDSGAIPLDYATGLDRVEECVLGWESGVALPTAKVVGTVSTVADALDKYLGWMDGFLIATGRPLHLAVDCANGMGGLFLPDWFARRPWLSATALFWELDGTFPNHEADPLKPKNLRDVQRAVLQHGCDFGVCFDGDADRCMFVDEIGQSVSSDLITALIAQQVLAKTPGSPIVYDLRSSRAVPETITQHGGRPVRERVGHTFMKRTLKGTGARFGGELSGHYYFADCFDTDSGLMALVQIINILQARQQPLSALIAPLQRYAATGELNFDAPDAAHTMAVLETLYTAQGAQIDHLDGLSVDFPDWWFNLRSSNTEPLLRLNLEAANAEMRDTYLTTIETQLAAHGATPSAH